MKRTLAFALVGVGAGVMVIGLWLAWPPLGIVAAGAALSAVGTFLIDIGGPK